MESSSGDLEGSSDDLTGKKKSRLKSLKMRLFGKRKGGGGQRKMSQSATDISQGKDEELDLEDSFSSSLGSRALSHESIFLAEQCLSSAEPSQGLSQENVPSRIKTLQMKLQQQNLRLGQPPHVMSIKRPEDTGGSSEDDGLPQSPPEIILNEVLPQRASYKPSSPTVPIIAVPSDTGIDFNTPPQFTPCLDNSAARHRMSVKPRNQRASAKVRKQTSQPDSRAQSESMNNMEHPIHGEEDEKGLGVSKEPIRFRSHSTQVLQTGESPPAHPDENHLLTSNRRSLKEPGIPHQSSSPMRPPVQPRPVMTETVITKSTFHSQPPVTKDQEPPVASVLSSRTEEAPAVSPAADPKNNQMAPETVGTKPPTSPRLRSASGTRQVGENLGIYPLKPAPASAPSTVVPQDTPASVSANADENDKQSVTGSQMAVLQNKTEIVDKKGNKSLNPQTEIRPKVQPVMAVGHSEGLPLEATQMRSFSKNEKASVKAEGESGMLPQTANVSAPRQTDKPDKVVENVVTSQQRPSSASPRFTISSAHNKDQTKTGSFPDKFEETGAKKDLTKPNFPHQAYCSQRGVQKGDMKAKELPPTLPAEMPFGGNVEPKSLQQGNSSGPDLEESLTLPHEIGEEATEEEDQDGVEVAVEAHEDLREHREEEPTKAEGEKNAFGVKLRSTSLSIKYRLDSAQSEVNVKRHSADVSTLSTTQHGSQAGPRAGRAGSLTIHAASTSMPDGQNISSLPSTDSAGGKLRSRSLRQEGEANQSTVVHPPKNVSMPSPLLVGLSAASSSVKVTSSSVSPAPLPSEEAGPSQPDDASPAPVKEPEGASSDFSWMSMAMEKTRTIQQLITSKLPEFPEGPTLPGATQTKKEFIPSPTVEGGLAPSPSVKRKSASSPTKQTPPASFPSKEATLPQSNDVASTAPSAKEPEQGSSEVSWMSMAREKTKTIQQLFTSKSPEFPGPQTTTRTTPTTETPPSMLPPAAQSTNAEKPSAQPSRTLKQTAPPDSSPTETTPSSTTVLRSRPGGQPVTKLLLEAESNSKPAPTSSSQSPSTPSIIRGTSLQEAQPKPIQPSIVSTQLSKLAQSQQTTAQSIPPSSLLNKTQPSPPLPSTQSIPRPSQPTANSHLSSSPKPLSHLKQQSQPAAPSVSQGSNDGLNSLKKRSDLPQPAPVRGSGAATAAAEGLGPRASGLGSKAAFLEKWGDKGASVGTKFEVSKATSGAQSSSESLTSVRPGHLSRDSKPDADLVLLRAADKEDRALKKTLISSPSPQQPASDGSQPSWMEMAKRKSLAWSDKSMN
ncbi:CRACD-like protein isoform X1 [Alosa sapidissima]|uniref:CRACD-like protein isoform X1 n=1 Tax=Alosa sapidissima TaxID=34773 RepID=UPI001C0A374A|nr:CRACD-like protein isoform X1 [Alosa sapidissima]XP_041925294.1 CRACD-like protein isoform X1 [Alosa sapidissima]XP_041925296.1 CRACD-like protein isoform X1 [Alosa sapidissima]